jgi:hypothetical protein
MSFRSKSIHIKIQEQHRNRILSFSLIFFSIYFSTHEYLLCVCVRVAHRLWYHWGVDRTRSDDNHRVGQGLGEETETINAGGLRFAQQLTELIYIFCCAL